MSRPTKDQAELGGTRVERVLEEYREAEEAMVIVPLAEPDLPYSSVAVTVTV